MSWLNGQHSCFLFGRSLVQISVWRLTVLSDVLFSSFPATVWLAWGFNCCRGKRFCFLQNIQTSSAAHSDSCSVSTMVLTSGWVMQLTILLHLVPRLRITGAIPLLPSVCLHGVDKEKFFFSLTSKHMPGQCLKLGHTSFLLQPFEFIMQHLS